MKCFRKYQNQRNIKIHGLEIKNVNSFKYLGTIVNATNIIEQEIRERITAGNRAYYAYKETFNSYFLEVPN